MVDPAMVRDRFRQRHAGAAPRLFAAPGRINLIGEHTDYNDGFVLPMAIDRAVVVAAAPRSDRRVRVMSIDLDDEIELDLDHPGSPRRGSWIDRVEGVARSLMARGVALGGADLVLASDVPQGAGLSSSAALEVAVGMTLWSLAGGEVDRVALALAAQAAENDWVGTRCGVMDPMIAALGAADCALLIDCRSLEARPVPLALPDHVIAVLDTRVTHDLASSAYNDRRAECERGVELLRRWLPDIRALRDVTPDAFEPLAGELPEPVRRRCRHVVGENARTLAAAAALAAGDLARFGRLMVDSHRSLRDDYEVSCPELDLLAEVAAATPGVLGGRMTGGGFGGCVIALCERDAEPRYLAAASSSFDSRFGRMPVAISSRAAAGAREVEA
ncbi:MAG TPA: galactokinase [Kofleriaceae bacterium]|nr:galactokinase [Kofleriaceae bacterium]